MTADKWKGYLMILGSAVCFAMYGVWSRLLGQEFGIFYQAWVRSAMILGIMLPIAIIGKHLKPIKKRDRKWFAITLLFTVFTQAPLYFAYNHLPLGTATFIFYGLFLLTSYVIGWLFLSEKISRVKIISFVLAVGGLLITFGLSLEIFSITAMLMAALNGIASGGEVASSKKSTDKYSSFQIVTYSYIPILLTHLPLSLLLNEKQFRPSLTFEWGAMVGYAIFGIMGYWLVVEGFKHVDASIGGLIGLLEIIFSVLLGIVLFDDQITLPIILGGCIIILAALLPDVYAIRHPKEKPLPPAPPL